jgi:hypothetical protein
MIGRATTMSAETPIFDRLVEEMGHPLRKTIEKAARDNKAALDQLAKPKPPPGRKGVKRQSA